MPFTSCYRPGTHDSTPCVLLALPPFYIFLHLFSSLPNASCIRVHAMHHILCRLHNMYQVHWRALSAGLGPTAAGPGVKSEECPVPNIPLRMHICCTQRTTQMAKLPWGLSTAGLHWPSPHHRSSHVHRHSSCISSHIFHTSRIVHPLWKYAAGRCKLCASPHASPTCFPLSHKYDARA